MGNILTTQGLEIVKILNDYFSSVFTKELNEMPECESKTDKNCPDPTFNEDIVKKILSELNPSKTPGVDDVHSYVLKMCADRIACQTH